MDYIQSSNKQVDKFGPGQHGFSPGNPSGGVPATYFTPDWTDGVQQEHINVIKASGLVPSNASFAQVVQAIKRMFGGNVTTVNAANSPFVLTADHAGLVIMDATAGNIGVTLPAVNAIAAKLNFQFIRVDATANTATVSRAGADTFIGGATDFTLTGQNDQRAVAGDAVNKWAATGVIFASSAEAQALTSLIVALSPGGLKAAFQGANQSLTSDGFQVLPGGLILQFMTDATFRADGADVVKTFPTAFPTACWAVFPVMRGVSSATLSDAARSATGCTVSVRTSSIPGFNLWAIGN